MRMVNPADQTFVKTVVESLGEEEVRLLPDLDVGEALLSGQMVNFPVLVRMKPPESRGERERLMLLNTLRKFELGMLAKLRTEMLTIRGNGMKIVVGLNLVSIKPKVWDKSSDYYLKRCCNGFLRFIFNLYRRARRFTH